MVAAKIKLDLNGKKGPDIWARIGEDATRQVVMKPGFFNDEGAFEQLVIDAEDIFAKFRVVKPDGTFVIYDASLYTPTSNPAEFVVTLTEEMSQVKGVGYYDLRIGDGETPDTFLYSASGRFIIDDDMITDEMIESVASVNGLIFPDDFLTSDALEEALTDYATKEYVDEAISEIPDPGHSYSTEETIVGTWVDGSTLYEKTVTNIPLTNNGWTVIFDGTDIGANIIDYNGIISLDGSKPYCKLDYYRSSGEFACSSIPASDNWKKIKVFAHILSPETLLYCTVRYTKS